MLSLSALLIARLSLPENNRRPVRRVEWMQTFRDVGEGLRFIRSNSLVRGVMIGLAGGLLGGGAMVPLGPVFAPKVLGAGSARGADQPSPFRSAANRFQASAMPSRPVARFEWK